MTTDEFRDVWASDTTLLSFDGRVLEVFGFSDTARYHVAHKPTITVGKKMVTIRTEGLGQHSFFFDQHRRSELEAYAARFGPF
ncbi:hypothetical protein EYE40_13840 [Glaciihabitans arcticus]|uniref:Uncharacterized protein n=1 Tax=Glaciihabitans arcticus TaxID=2668039 RepID=A0A4Q9GTJ7_9MICO|nr:hypothetical protein [Glaciihabitans arcticus]TBN58386.1 hypothetical protein EYE40_13840 [Glaciihabitans arcticus]